MYLAKFFHRAPGDDDRELMLIPGSEPMVMGVRMNWEGEPGEDQYLREEFGEISDAAAAFRRHVAELVAGGYVETDHTKHSLRDLGPDPKAKPDWQKGLDELMILALSAPMTEQAKQIEALKGSPAEREPLYLWHAARRDYAEDHPALAVRFAEQARDTIRARRAAGQPHYAWSLYENDLEGRILELLSDAYLAADDPEASLKTIEHLCKNAPNHDRFLKRAELLCGYFPERREEAFDDAYQWSRFGGYEDIMAFPGYEEYAARRKAGTSEKGWRWKPGTRASEADVSAAEQALGARLPDDYRNFLLTRGETELLVRLPEASSELRFYAPGELATQLRNVLDFIAHSDDELEEACAYFRKEFGVSLKHLVPVAEPSQLSRCLLLHVEPGAGYGQCFQWDHDGAWELDQKQPSFDVALRRLTDGIEQRDAAQLAFFDL
ncbi:MULTISPECIES: SMI1/KNR4 family protein [unclassified Bradyrhizobium]|uniref:SMI1/KNR4 family protein n=1 Tax=unclassified Bradyrhizobium TaxID=2631580 RepID=UPI00211E1543|nr:MULTISPECIES: SMI1/KNR4 family protein [unclassified Bradyrhizobium]MDD1532162.1 SMI1/KNR4 family protein [Bradyrhizobium sp. WBOS8]MDD1583443.1 SMI1/KNR4 family protein [Bradyrhizobium sp. WBOS4]UUO46363.1 SMI1/KNR4 family protein [Bradyrhizobium sp. WBOS04]UUO59944.1 SMI1/KNR4 family protein [Bradyrhizobium sp. WBOS08]